MTTELFTKAFVTALTERALKTFCQSLAAMLVAAGTGILDTEWQTSFSVAGMAALISVLTNVASGAVNGQPAAFGDEKVEEES